MCGAEGDREVQVWVKSGVGFGSVQMFIRMEACGCSLVGDRGLGFISMLVLPKATRLAETI